MLLALLIPVPAHAEGVEGFLELRAQGLLGVDGQPITLVERLRPEFSASLGDRLSLSSTVELALAQGRRTQDELERTISESDLGPIFDAAGCSWPQETNAFLGISGVGDYLSVERLYGDAYLPRADLRLGRQAINWGSAFMVNPTDPFPEVLLTEPWKSRAGVNALRITVPMGERHQVQIVAGGDDSLTKARLATRATINVLNTDLSLVGAWRQEAESAIAGLDLRGTLGVGWWLEGSVHLDTSEEERQDPYEELAAGLDYSFPLREALILKGQYYRNGAGSPTYDPAASAASMSDAIEAPTCAAGDLFPTVATDPFAPFFHGRDYAMASASLSWSPELAFNAIWIQNLGDGSALAVPALSAFPLGWLEISAAAQIPLSTWGTGGELHSTESDLVVSMGPAEVDFSGLMPDATFILWTRLDF